MVTKQNNYSHKQDTTTPIQHYHNNNNNNNNNNNSQLLDVHLSSHTVGGTMSLKKLNNLQPELQRSRRTLCSEDSTIENHILLFHAHIISHLVSNLRFARHSLPLGHSVRRQRLWTTSNGGHEVSDLQVVEQRLLHLV